MQLWRRTFNGALLSSPAVARVKQDGTLAVILDTRAADGVLYALNAEGKTLWTYDTGQTQPFTAVSDLDEDGLDEIAVGGVGLTLLASDGTVLWNVPLGRTNAPVIGDVDNDGRLEVVAATGGGLVAAFSAEGEELWRCEVDDNLEMPVLSDLNGDGALDLVVGGERSLWAVSGDGQPLWKAGLPGESLYSPAVGDLDGDGKPEIVAFTRTDFNGTLSVFGSDGTLLWDTRITREADWCPMIVDLLGVGQPQILVQAAKWEDLALYNAVGERVWTIPIESRIIQTPVPVDFDGDGRLDVALACNESRRIWALTIEGAPLWSYIPHSYVLGGAKVKGGGSLLIADIDGDERLEVVGGDDETWLNAVQTDTPCERWAVVSGQFHGDARHSGYYCISKK